MMEYNKPEFYVEEFVPNTSVAACDRLPTDNYTYQKVTVKCIASGSDTIFDSNACKGYHEIDPNASGTQYTWYNHTVDSSRCEPDDWHTVDGERVYTDCDENVEYGLYYIWQSERDGSAQNNVLNKLNHILSYVGIDGWNDAPGDNVWHAGLVTDDYMKQLYSHSA